MINSICTR